LSVNLGISQIGSRLKPSREGKRKTSKEIVTKPGLIISISERFNGCYANDVDELSELEYARKYPPRDDLHKKHVFSLNISGKTIIFSVFCYWIVVYKMFMRSANNGK
jgi:hypothetical protein